MTRIKYVDSTKSLYGLKQFPQVWFDKFTKVVKHSGYVQAQIDHTLFIKHKESGKIAVLLVYVDNNIATGNDRKEIKTLKASLCKVFELKDLGTLRYYLGMEVARSQAKISTSQRKYNLDLLQEIGISGYRPTNNPIEPKRELGLEEDAISVDRERYQHLVGKMIYLSHTRPDIAFVVSLINQFMHSPREKHLEVVYRILRYLKGTLEKAYSSKE